MYPHIMGPAPAKQLPLRLIEILTDSFLQVDLLSYKLFINQYYAKQLWILK